MGFFKNLATFKHQNPGNAGHHTTLFSISQSIKHTNNKERSTQTIRLGTQKDQENKIGKCGQNFNGKSIGVL